MKDSAEDRPALSLRLRLALLAYGAVWVLAVPFVLLYLLWRSRKDAGYRAHLGQRFGLGQALPGAVWVHAVSLGELRSATPLVKALLARGETVVTTHFTPAGRREAETVFAADIAAGRMAVRWVPFELGLAYAAFMAAHKPKFALVMEVEIWPRMIFAARRHGVPLFLANAQYPIKSYERDRTRTGLRAEIMRHVAGALVKSDIQQARFASVGVRNVQVTGELRFDQPIPQALVQAGRAARAWLDAGARRTLTIASSVEGEDDIYIRLVLAMKADAAAHGLPAPLIIWVPRRKERFDMVEATIRAAGLSVARRSVLFDAAFAQLGAALDCDVLLGDSYGEMYGYLAMADRVLVGGGFHPKSAHNIIEPLALKKPVITGPVTYQIEYPFVEAEAAGVARSVPDEAALIAALTEGWEAVPSQTQIDAFFAAHSGATAKMLAALDQQITSR